MPPPFLSVPPFPPIGGCAPSECALSSHPPSRFFGFRSNFSLVFHSTHHFGLRVLLGSISETGWDNLASRAATSEWWGEGTYVALVA